MASTFQKPSTYYWYVFSEYWPVFTLKVSVSTYCQICWVQCANRFLKHLTLKFDLQSECISPIFLINISNKTNLFLCITKHFRLKFPVISHHITSDSILIFCLKVFSSILPPHFLTYADYGPSKVGQLCASSFDVVFGGFN